MGQPVMGQPVTARRPTTAGAGCHLVLLCSPGQRLTLPPEQCDEYQVELSGKIRLACGRGPRVGTHH
jgi:hypothetical protein